MIVKANGFAWDMISHTALEFAWVLYDSYKSSNHIIHTHTHKKEEIFGSSFQHSIEPF